MNALLNKHYKLFFLLVCIYPIYLDIYNTRYVIDWFHKTTMQMPYVHLKKHEVIAILLYATNISLIISIVAIGSEEHDFFKKLEMIFLEISALGKVIFAAIFGAICYLIPLAMDFIQDNQKTSTTQLFLIGFASISFSIFMLRKYMSQEVVQERKDKTFRWLIKLLIALFCAYLFVKPTSIEVYKKELSAMMRESDDAKFYKETIRLLKESEEDNAQLTEEAFMWLEPFRNKNTMYANSYESVLSDFCTPQALQKIAELTNRNYPYQLRASIRDVQRFSKDDMDRFLLVTTCRI